MNTPYELDRFTEAQDMPYDGYEQALAEIRAGRKYSHWIWYIFPQLKGLGHSPNARFYGLESQDEAALYLAHPVLGPRLREITAALLSHCSKDPVRILGHIDAQKVCSCMTLFDAVAPGEIFAETLAAFYESRPCELTLRMLQQADE